MFQILEITDQKIILRLNNRSKNYFSVNFFVNEIIFYVDLQNVDRIYL